VPISDYVKNIRARIGSDLLLLPGVTAIVFNASGEVLLQLRRDSNTWAPPSGGVDPGETVAEAVRREVLEEAGIEIEPLAIVAVLSGAEYNVTYPNGDQLAAVTTVFRCRQSDAASPHINDDESQDIRFFKTEALPDIMAPRHRWMIDLAQNNGGRVYFDQPSA
jgi:8-oxo-dGTP diphosphatase